MLIFTYTPDCKLRHNRIGSTFVAVESSDEFTGRPAQGKPSAVSTGRSTSLTTDVSRGDTLHISDEAHEMLVSMRTEQGCESTVEAMPRGTVPESSTRADEEPDNSGTEPVDHQLSRLRTRLFSLISQLSSNGCDVTMMGKINVLQSQIAALEVELIR